MGNQIVQEPMFKSEDVIVPRRMLRQISVVVRTTETEHTDLQSAFEAFHATNPGVYDALLYLARTLRRRGRTRIGMKMLFEVLRWQYQLSTTDSESDFKLNNNYTSRYARLLSREPDLEGCFEVRSLRA